MCARARRGGPSGGEGPWALRREGQTPSSIHRRLAAGLSAVHPGPRALPRPRFPWAAVPLPHARRCRPLMNNGGARAGRAMLMAAADR